MLMVKFDGIVPQSRCVLDENDGWKIGSTFDSAYHERRTDGYSCGKERTAM